MEQLKNEQTEVTKQPAEAEINKGELKTEVSLGKFKDVSALLNAYNSLESEFTKRCQKLKELESAISLAEKERKNLPTEQENEQKAKQKDITEEEKLEILKEYLSKTIGKKQTAVVLGGEGVSVKTPINRPKTIKQAGELANEIFNNR